MKQPFPYYIEDWIHWFAKRKDDLGNEVDFPYYRTWPIKLANYDVQFITRSSDGFMRGVGLTDRQVTTAVKIITKYKRQIKNKLDRDVDYIATDRPLMLPIREVDRSFKVQSLDKYYFVQFPYLPLLVDKMHQLVAKSSGDFSWNKEKRAWFIAKTEVNLRLLYQFIQEFNSHYWQIDNETAKHFSVVDEVLAEPYLHIPTLDLVNNTLVVTNSNEFLTNSIEYILGFDIPNATIRADNYGVAIGKNLEQYICNNYKNISRSLLTPQHIIFEKSKSLTPHLSIENLESFMTTVRSDYWVFLSCPTPDRTGMLFETAIDIDVPGEKIFYSDRRFSVTSHLENFISENKKDKDIVIFVDNHMVLKRILSTSVIAHTLKIFYLYGDTSI